MRRVMQEKLPRLTLTLLMAAGIVFPFLSAFGMEGMMPRCALMIAGCVLALEAVFLTRRTALIGCPALLAGALFWLLGGGGMARLTDLGRAFSLRLSGVPGALPLVAGEAAMAMTVVISLLSFLCARPGMGGLGAVLLAAGGLLALWLGDFADRMVWLLPAWAAALCLMVLERRPEVSFLRILPWAAALAVLAWALIPPEGLVIPALKERADSLRQTVMDRLFFTEPRDVFSLSAEGYYPQGISQLGGPISPSDHLVMQVSAQRTAYLRGALMNEYDGRCWRNTLGGRRYLWDSAGMAAQRRALFDQELPPEGLSGAMTEAAEISVRMLSDGASTLFVPQRVRELRTGGELVPYFTNSSELFSTRNLQPGDTWAVSAPLFTAGDPGLGTLIDAAEAGEDLRFDALRETYTALPGHLEEPVWQMAADVTAGLTSPYEKAFALQNWLSRNYRYTLEVAWQPSDVDFVTSFLFHTKEGYCTYFASAMTVLCRMAGLPARYVEGYLAEPDARGEAVVTGLDAHAWTEVYFRGFGWVTFDATPHRAGGGAGETPEESSARPSDSPDPQAAEPPAPTPPTDSGEQDPGEASPPEEPDGQPPDGASSTLPDDPDRPGFPWWLIPLILVLLAAAAGARWLLTSPARRERKCAEEGERFDLWMEDVTRRLAAGGMQRAPGETLMGFTRRLDAEGRLSANLAPLGECASLLRYGRVRAMESDTALARDAAVELKKTMKGRARMRYAINRLRGKRADGTPGRGLTRMRRKNG